LRPDCLESFCSTGRYGPDGEGYGRDLVDPERLVARARAAIGEGIAAERLHANPMHAGEPVDVALVDADGARFVFGGG
jgi:hypothetical protein